MKPVRFSILNTPFAILVWFVLMVLSVFMAPLWAGASSPGHGPASSAGEVAKRPNILFIYTDDQSHRTVSSYPGAYGWARTPNVDRLAERGVRFASAYIGTWCMPSRATLLTGLLPHGVQSMKMEGTYPGSTYDPEQCPFWPRVFREHGYFTAQIGKWHTGTDTGFGRDWDFQIVWNRPRFTDNATHYYYDQLITFNGGETRRIQEYSTDNYTRWAEEFIRGEHRDPDKPWYLWLCYGASHDPFTPADRHLESYPDVSISTPADIYPPRPGKPAYMQEVEFWVRGSSGQPVLKSANPSQSEKTLTDWVRQYHQSVRAIDEGVGRLIRLLEETGQLENTLVVYTADQGFAWGQHGFRTKIAPYDATIRGPLIISMPGTIPEGGVGLAPVGGQDLVPTFFHFAGIELPWKMHGQNLTPLLHDPGSDWPHPVLMVMTGDDYGSDTDVIPTDASLYATPQIPDGDIPWWISLRQGRYKYIQTLVENEIEELYDLENDPEELTNLALDVNHRATLLRFRQATRDELRRTGAAMADRLPGVRPLP